METEVKIVPPPGYEIDRENSTFECIKFKSKKLTYEDIAKELFYFKPTYFIDLHGGVTVGTSVGTDYADPNNALSQKQCEKLLALNKLINVAKYLNGDWKPTFDGHQLNYALGISNNEVIIDYFSKVCHVGPCFKSRDLAKQALEILGEETIKLALSQI